ncbi:aspartate ammonia-lyase [Marinicrinis sediminis]|uniref:Aspartate ammonia-lyase n=1 Tax=Marinicrinis sediminis TaxID=1652465 RepID=A0ABW5R770_9BACL
MRMQGYRKEHDFLGEKQVEAGSYYGVQTLRAVENFPIMGVPIHRQLIVSLAKVKKAAALANMDIQLLKKEIGEAIVKAADEVMAGKWIEAFIVDSIQGGAGTSINMNMNEVLANRALEWMGHQKGEYFHCNPNNHVNMSQSTNDTIPTALRIAAYQLTQRLLQTMRSFHMTLLKKSRQFDSVIKMGRTHLQDAVPIRLGQEFAAYAGFMSRNIERVDQACRHLLTINMGATAVGTGLNAGTAYMEKVTGYLQQLCGLPLKHAGDLVDATQNTDAYVELSAALKVTAVNLSKMCNDLRLMASGPRAGLSEIFLPPRQPGSSIMPGKVNPVMLEVMNQIAFQVMGNDHTICMASEAGQFELNVMVPVISFNLLQSLDILNNGLCVLEKYAMEGLEANMEQCKQYVSQSFGVITALNPHLGYETAAQIVKEALKTGATVKEIILERQLLTEEELTVILDPYQMTSPGIAGIQFLHNQ